MDREAYEQLKLMSVKKKTITRSIEKEGRLFSEEEQNRIKQIDLERDELLGEIYFKTY